MPIKNWKYWWSFFQEVELEEVDSDFSDFLVVSLNKGQYQLSTSRAIYSYGKHYYNYSRIFDKYNFPINGLKKALILGYGLGSVPQILSQYYLKLEVTGVEIDPAVIYLNEKYGFEKNGIAIQVEGEDAEYFMESCNDKFDFIAIDIFIGDIIPDEFEAISFLENIKASLNGNGLVVYNRVQYTTDKKRESEYFFNNVFKKVFPDGKAHTIKGNLMLCNY